MASRLIITADDFGMSPAYDRGILNAVRAGAVDSVGLMVLRDPARAAELLETGVAVGLHAEAADADAGIGTEELLRQLDAFERIVGRPPDFLDGHHHCHAAGDTRTVAKLAAQHGLPVRSVDAEHRRVLREAGVRTPDLLVGRYEESHPVVPAELLAPARAPGWIEWMVHPGVPDPALGSSYDRGRGEDLEALLAFQPPAGMERGDHRALVG